MELNDIHKLQVSRYMAFFKGKRERLISDRMGELTDFKSDRLSDDQAIFNSRDVESLLDVAQTQALAGVREEVEAIINLSAVYLSQVLLQAETGNMTLDGADVANIEGQNRVDQIAMLAMSGQAPQALQKRQQTGSLQPLEEAPPAAMAELMALKETNRQMLDRYQSMQTQVSELLRERSALSGELDKVRTNFAQLHGHMTAEAQASQQAADIQRSLNESKHSLEQKNTQVVQMQEELQKRLGDSTQFRDLKAIVKKKNDEVKLLKQIMVQAGLAPPASDGGVELSADDD